MKLSIVLALGLTKCLLINAAHLLTLRDGPSPPVGKIMGGHEAKPHSHPYVVSLQIRLLWARAHLCGGSLLNEQWVLTAGHCIKESWIIRWLPLDAIVGAHNVNNFDPEAQISPIEQRIAHPKYQGGIGPYDVAVLKTKTPFTFNQFVKPIRLPADMKSYSDTLTLAGWGVLRTTFFFPDFPSRLQEVNVSYIPYDDCYQAIEDVKLPFERNPLNKEANMCTGPLTGGIAACSGDSGGPLIDYIQTTNDEITTNDPVRELEEEEQYFDLDNSLADSQDRLTEIGRSAAIDDSVDLVADNKDASTEDKIPTVVGVVSWGAEPCGEEGAPTVYSKVTQYIDFIQEHINK